MEILSQKIWVNSFYNLKLVAKIKYYDLDQGTRACIYIVWQGYPLYYNSTLCLSQEISYFILKQTQKLKSRIKSLKNLFISNICWFYLTPLIPIIQNVCVHSTMIVLNIVNVELFLDIFEKAWKLKSFLKCR